MSGREVPVVAWMRTGAESEMHNFRLDDPRSPVWTPLVSATDYAALLAEHEALLARVEADRMDVERYRWLRDQARQNTSYDIFGGGGLWTVGVHSKDSRQNLDAAIDAARQGA